MQMQSKKLLTISLMLLSILGGCKKKSTRADNKKQSLVSKENKKSAYNKSQSTSVDPLELDTDSMKGFALDDHISKHESSKTATPENSNPLFSWENVDADKSRHQFKTLYFDFDKDNIKTSEEPALRYDIDEAKKMIKQGKTIVIEGHACHSAGSAAYNMAISERRARSVAQKFAEHNIDAANIKIAPRGQEMPVRKGGSKKEQWVNRRVEIYAIDSK
jgi:outer membrane protein OmpA-like peptidoglycan-associated protein